MPTLLVQHTFFHIPEKNLFAVITAKKMIPSVFTFSYFLKIFC